MLDRNLRASALGFFLFRGGTKFYYNKTNLNQQPKVKQLLNKNLFAALKIRIFAGFFL